MKKLILFLCIALISCSQNLNVRNTGTGMVVETETCQIEVVCYSDNIVRILKSPLSRHRNIPDSSLSVVMKPEKVRYAIRSIGDSIVTISTDSLTASLNLVSSTLSFSNAQGGSLVSEKPHSLTMEPMDDAGAPSFEVSQTFLLDDTEAIYGLGQHQGGGLNMRGKELTLQNVNTEIAIPLIHSSKGYALFWDNTSTTEFRDCPDGMTLSSQVGDLTDYYLIYGGNADGVISGIRRLTGESPMFPLWSYGFHQSRERYTSQDELISVVDKYRSLGVPLDGIIQDWQYWGTDNHYWNAVEFLNPRYSDPEGMIDAIHDRNAHILISVWPSFGPETGIFKDLDSKGLLMAHETYPQGYGVRNYDPFDKRAREIYWSWMKRNMFDIGMDGWWLDATEPEHSPVKESDYDYITPKGSFRKVRNAYPIASVGGVFDAQRAETANKRVFILTRSATAGIQRYGAHVWSGDVTSGWGQLHNQIPAALNLSMCGIPYWNSDIGGFFSAYNYPDGNKDEEYRRLYLRWTEFGTFTGMMRSHGTHTHREIWNFGKPGDFYFDALKKYIDLRYLLLPYIYSEAWNITSSAGTLMRPMFMDWASDMKTLDIDDQYMFGRNILVAPVTADVTSRNVYLPEGNWIDFWTGCYVAGGVNFSCDAPLDIIPLYVKAGSIIPAGPEVQYAAQKPWDSLQIRIYPGEDGQFDLYEDSGDGYDYEDGAYSIIRFRWDDRNSSLTILPIEGQWPGMISERDFRIILVRYGKGTGLDTAAEDLVVHYSGQKLTVNLAQND